MRGVERYGTGPRQRGLHLEPRSTLEGLPGHGLYSFRCERWASGDPPLRVLGTLDRCGSTCPGRCLDQWISNTSIRLDVSLARRGSVGACRPGRSGTRRRSGRGRWRSRAGPGSSRSAAGSRGRDVARIHAEPDPHGCQGRGVKRLEAPILVRRAEGSRVRSPGTTPARAFRSSAILFKLTLSNVMPALSHAQADLPSLGARDPRGVPRRGPTLLGRGCSESPIHSRDRGVGPERIGSCPWLPPCQPC